tara:strand:- start:160 stop:432 length:273 start_codon:yes stop_codon:yes gene_type:complete
MLLALFLPHAGQNVMVVTGHGSSIYSLLEGTDGRVVEQLSSGRYIVQGEELDLVTRLYKNGAFLVVNAPPRFGCAQPAKDILGKFYYKEI